MNKIETFARESGTPSHFARASVNASVVRHNEAMALLAEIHLDAAPALEAARKASTMLDSIGVASARFIAGDTSRMSRAGAVSARDGRGDGHIQTHAGFAGYACEAYGIGTVDLPSAFAPLVASAASADVERPEMAANGAE